MASMNCSLVDQTRLSFIAAKTEPALRSGILPSNICCRSLASWQVNAGGVPPMKTGPKDLEGQLGSRLLNLHRHARKADEPGVRRRPVAYSYFIAKCKASREIVRRFGMISRSLLKRWLEGAPDATCSTCASASLGTLLKTTRHMLSFFRRRRHKGYHCR